MKYNIALATKLNLSATSSLKDTISKNLVQYNKSQVLLSLVLSEKASQQFVENLQNELKIITNQSAAPLVDVMLEDTEVERMEICVDYTQETNTTRH